MEHYCKGGKTADFTVKQEFNIFRQIADYLRLNRTTLKKVFDKHDENTDGYLTRKQFENFLL